MLHVTKAAILFEVPAGENAMGRFEHLAVTDFDSEMHTAAVLLADRRVSVDCLGQVQQCASHSRIGTCEWHILARLSGQPVEQMSAGGCRFRSTVSARHGRYRNTEGREARAMVDF